MRKSIFLGVVSIFLLCENSPAALIDRGTGMIYDTEQGITWLQDANYAQTSGYDADGAMDWNGANQWASQLEFGGFSDWRLPSALNQDGTGPDYPFYTTGSEMGNLYYKSLENIAGAGPHQSGPFLNIQPTWYWSGTELDFNYAWYFNFGNGWQYDDPKWANHSAWAVRDGDYGPSVSTDQTYLTDFITLGDTFSFDYYWDMGTEPTESNFDVLFFNGTEWETFGWELNLGGSSVDWASASFYVPTWARGENVQIKFSLLDLGQQTDPTVYLRNIASNSAPVPEPSTLILFGSGLAGLAAVSRRRQK